MIQNFSKLRKTATGVGLSLAVMAVALFVGNANFADAGTGIGVTPNFPSPVTVGQTGVAVSMDITNNSSADVGALTLDTIHLTPSCGNSSNPCTSADPGVFAVSATATGAGACAANTFTVAVITPSTGEVSFTPNSTISLALGATCTINFTVDVLKTPTVDASGAAGLQTGQAAQITAHDTATGDLPATGTGADITTVNKASPTIATVPSAGGPIGTVLNDTATLSGGISPTGSVTFSLYPPSDATCAGTASFTETDPTSPYATTTGFTSNAAGVWHWTAAYAGDSNNNAVTSPCSDEAVTVTKISSSTTTEVHDSTEAVVALSSTIANGTTVHDKATVTGAGPTPTGNVAFTFFSGTGSSVCDAQSVASGVVALDGSGIAHPSSSQGPLAAGSYAFKATYAGDSNYDGSTSSCEPFSVGKASPSISTTPSAGGVVGTVLNDTASVTGGSSPTGDVTFKLFPPSDTSCTGTPVYSQVDSSAPYATSPGYTSLVVGTYHWTADYAGDSNNNAVSSGCTDEPVVVTKASPSISTTPSAGGSLGTVLNDTATLSGGSSPTGNVTFNLYPPSDPTCAGTAVYTQVVAASPYATSPGFTSDAVGTYHWTAAYAGDANNNAVSSACADESAVITQNQPSIATSLSATTVNVNTAVHDSATLTGATATAGGTVTYNVYAGTACTGTPVFTSTVNVANGVVPDSGSFTPTTAGTYNWQAVYSGDVGNAGATSPCQTEVLTVNQPAEYCSPGYWKQPQHFDSWKVYSPTDKFSAVFGETITIMWSSSGKPGPVNDPTLLQALQANGGGINALARAAVDALLNSTSINSGLTSAQVISETQAAIDAGAPYTVPANFTATENCPLN